MARRAQETDPPAFATQTVLFHWMLHQLDADCWEALPLTALHAAEAEPSRHTPTPFARALQTRPGPRARLSDAQLHQLDARVVDATARINARRGHAPIRWRTFQYLALLFTELYLARLFTDRAALRAELNAFLAAFCADRSIALPPYAVDPCTGIDDLSKLAFWQATGSGKTLLMHAHLHQYLAALARHGQPRPDHVLLITPSAGLARQHARDMAQSGIRGSLFQKGRSAPFRADVQILEITRLRAQPGPDTVSPARFEGTTLLFVDEGHRGSSKADGEWRRIRQQLAATGFCFEYSATFAQAAMKDDAIRTDYARSVVMDYAYRRFHGDGYGKHWRILNIGRDPGRRARLREAEVHRSYLTGALTVLFQQLQVHRQHRALARRHHLARPFCIFVGASVTGGREGAAEQTDILKVIAFLARFTHPRERARNEQLLDALLAGRLGFETGRGDGTDIFHPQTVFPELLAAAHTGASLYAAILQEVFHTDHPGMLHVQELPEADGEMALSVGDAPPYAVVNVGDVTGVRKRCEDRRYAGLIDVQPRQVRGSLFDTIDAPDSPLHMLIGSRKFTEGWSSWRVSVMGLLNLGRTPGTQIVQLFGRGVRLLGKGRSLKRSSTPSGPAPAGSEASVLRVLETLSVFGIQADYMDQFEAELRAHQGTAAGAGTSTPPPSRPPRPVPPQTRATARSDAPAPRAVLEIDPAVRPVRIDAYPRVQLHTDLASTDPSHTARLPQRHTTTGPLPCFAFVDHDRLYTDLVRLRDLRGWTGLSLPRVVQLGADAPEPLTRSLLRQGGWYTLEAPPWLLALDGAPARPGGPRRTPLDTLPVWQQLASELLCAYAEAFWRHQRRAQTHP